MALGNLYRLLLNFGRLLKKPVHVQLRMEKIINLVIHYGINEFILREVCILTLRIKEK